MEQMSLFAEERSHLFERLCTVEFLKEGFNAVKKNGGSPGIDGVTVKEFGSRLDEELRQVDTGATTTVHTSTVGGAGVLRLAAKGRERVAGV